MLGLHVTDARKSRISELPYDIVVSIISFLTIKEAMATSVLSSRWRHMWTYTTGSWRFNLSELRNDYEKYETVTRVNQALELHRGPFLYELGFCMDRTYYPVVPQYTSIIGNWVSIASRKCVRRLDLNMPDIDLNKIVQTFPVFSHLTHLTLKSIKVTEETLCYFLSSCVLLEHLCLIDLSQLMKLKVGGGSSLKLKHLEISDCFRLRSLEISAPNLVSFVCRGLKTTALFKDLPLLSTLAIVPGCVRSLKLIEPLSYFSQIESLTLELSTSRHVSGLSLPDHLELSNLKHLELRIEVFFLNSFLPFTSLLKASPLLSSLKIELATFRQKIAENWIKFVPDVNWRKHKKIGKEERLTHEGTIYRHQCLREVTLCGFFGHALDTGIALHLIGMATSLEKMVIDCSQEIPCLTPESLRNERIIARQIAEELRSKLPPATEFVVL